MQMHSFGEERESLTLIQKTNELQGNTLILLHCMVNLIWCGETIESFPDEWSMLNVISVFF